MPDAICLASGGLDSTLCLHLLKQEGLQVIPLFIDYGQLNSEREFGALKRNCTRHEFAPPIVCKIPGFGELIKSGLTDANKHIKEDAFTPNRNLLFLVMAASVAFSKGTQNLVMGLLSEKSAIFPDQTDEFLNIAQAAISSSLGITMRIHCPLRDFTKMEVVKLATSRGIAEYYSCHAGTPEPCGGCIACLEYSTSGD